MRKLQPPAVMQENVSLEGRKSYARAHEKVKIVSQLVREFWAPILDICEIGIFITTPIALG